MYTRLIEAQPDYLIERGIDASLIPRGSTNLNPERVAAIMQDHADALEEMFAFVRGERALTVGYIKELHAALLRNVDTATRSGSVRPTFRDL